METVQEVKIFPIVTHFLDKPVRFFPMVFEIEMRGHNAPQPSFKNSKEIGYHNDTQSWSKKVVIETQAIPLPDYCTAIGVAENNIRRMINISNETFKSFYRIEPIPDALGRIRETIIMAQEMVDGLTFKLHTSRIKDPQTRERVIEFQKWAMIMLGMIRRGQLRPIHIPKDASIPHQAWDFLALEGRKIRGEFQKQARQELGWSRGKFYKMANLARQSIGMPPAKRPHKDKGSFVNRHEFKQVEEYLKDHTDAGGKAVKAALDIPVNVCTVRRWLRYIRAHKVFLN